MSQMASPYPSPDAMRLLVDTSHANEEAAEFFKRFFAAKNQHDLDATMAFISTHLSVYADAAFCVELESYAAFKNSTREFMPSWGAGRSILTRILGELHNGDGSALIVFTDTPELFGAELHVFGSVDVKGGKVTRWIDYWDSATYPGEAFRKIKKPAPATPLALRYGESISHGPITGVARTLAQALAAGDAAKALDMFAYHSVFEDECFNVRIVGKEAIGRYLERALRRLPYGPGMRLGHVVGGTLGGGFEWVAGPSSAARTGAAAIALNQAAQIVRFSLVYDARDIPEVDRQAIALLGLEPVR